MSIITIPNQPVAFDYDYDNCNSCDDREYSMPVFEDDNLCFQIKQSPCGPNVICDPTFEELSANLVTNGTFYLNATGWTLGAGWVWNVANNVKLTTNTGALTQTVTITPLRRYIVRFVVSGVTGTPNLIVKLGGSSSIAAITAAGSYTRVLIADNINSLLSFNDGTGTATYSLDSVEMYEISPCWSMDSSWDLTEPGYATHIAGNTSSLTQTTPPLTAVRYYRITTTITNYVSGSVRANVGGALCDPLSANGTFVQYKVSAGTSFGYVPTTDFVGSITFVEAQILRLNFLFQSESTCDDVVVRTATLTNKGTYFNEFVTFCFKPFDFLPRTLPCYDCFRLVLPDLCTEYGPNFIRNGSFSQGLTDWTNYNWTAGFRNIFCYKTIGGLLIQPYDGTNTEVIPFSDPHTKFWYEITVSGTVSAIAYVQLYIGGRLLVTVTAPGKYSGVVTTLPMLSNAVRVSCQADGAATINDLIFVDDVRVGYITEVDRELISQPFKLVDEDPTTDCTKVITAYCDENNFGFNFTDTDFKIKQRMQILKVNPIYAEQRNDYLFSDGTRKITYGQSEKYWSVRTGFIPEHLHDVLRLQVLCDHLLMDDAEFYDKGGDYTPDYLGGNDYVVLSSVTREWRKKTENIFNSNCNNS